MIRGGYPAGSPFSAKGCQVAHNVTVKDTQNLNTNCSAELDVFMVNQKTGLKLP